MKGFIVFLLMLSSCEKIFSQKDSVVTNIVQPKSITDVATHTGNLPYYRLGDKITIDGKSYIIEVDSDKFFITIPPPIITYDTVDVIMLVTDTAYHTEIMDRGFMVKQMGVNAIYGYLVTKKIDKGTFPYTTENVGYLDIDFAPVKNKIVWMSVRNTKNNQHNEKSTYHSPNLNFDTLGWHRASPNK